MPPKLAKSNLLPDCDSWECSYCATTILGGRELQIRVSMLSDSLKDSSPSASHSQSSGARRSSSHRIKSFRVTIPHKSPFDAKIGKWRSPSLRKRLKQLATEACFGIVYPFLLM
mmetsp:Transcript_43496/g.125584  ORF Transcript_43496/g.125584 Transcript_43496/m.125584 type:complete len:114 (+) Transcript_43496:82-423(+)